eukprot:scaffold7626_cov159-Amphora_coffeaeformis.AAC.5
MGSQSYEAHRQSLSDRVGSSGGNLCSPLDAGHDSRSKRQTAKDFSPSLIRTHIEPINPVVSKCGKSKKKVKWLLPPCDRWASFLHETSSNSNQASLTRISNNACLPRRR